jgi:hypothetical protein
LAKELWKFSLQIVSSWCARFSLKQCFASETLFEARPPCSSFFFGKVENGIYKFQKNMKKNLNVIRMYSTIM